jgi:hypothetical protein
MGAANSTALGQVNLEKSPVLSPELAERMQGFDDAGSLRPSATGAGGETDDADLAATKRI